MTGKKRGRPPSGFTVRTHEVKCSLTAQDAAWLERVAPELGFENRSQMLQAILERLILARFAAFAFLQVGWMLSTRATETGSSKGAGHWNPFRDPIPPLDPLRPPPVLPDERPSARATNKLLAEVRKELLHK